MQLAQIRTFEPGVEEQGGVATFQGLEAIFNNVVAVALGLAGIIFFIMLLAGGFKYISSGGDPKGVEEAKKTLTYAIGGLVLLVLSFLILRFIKEFTGVDVTQFKVTIP